LAVKTAFYKKTFIKGRFCTGDSQYFRQSDIAAATACLLVMIRFPGMFDSGDTAENAGYILSTITVIDIMVIYFAAVFKYSGLILILTGCYLALCSRSRPLNNQQQTQNDIKVT